MIVKSDTQRLEEDLVTQAEAIVNPPQEQTSDQDFLAARGYQIQKEIGVDEGATRRAFIARRTVGNLTLEGILKIPREAEEITSINAKINGSKRNLNLQEAIIGGKLRHPGIARIQDSFQMPDGRTVNFEDKIDGWSLSTFLQKAGPVKDKTKLGQIFSPVISALAYVHEGQFGSEYNPYIKNGILHRDITPKNILIPTEGNAGGVITDWQNAAFRADIAAISLPTRGGTKYTHPELLNALMTGDRSKSTESTEVYSLGATMYEAVTGEKAFDYLVVETPHGKEVKVNGETMRLGLTDGNKGVETITPEMHKANLKKAKQVMKAKKVPVKVANLIEDMLTVNGKNSIYEMETVKSRFAEATDTTAENLKRDFGKYVKTALVTAGACIGVGIAAILGVTAYHMPNESQRGPTLSDIMRGQDRMRALARGDYSSATALAQYGNSGDFQKYISEAESRRAEIEGDFEKELEYANRMNTVDKRLTSALIRSILLESEDTRNTLAGKEKYGHSLVPKEYVKVNFDLISKFEEKDLDEFRQKMWMGRYIQESFRLGDSVEEVYAKALCSAQELELAKARTNQRDMMKTLQDKGFRGMGGVLIPIGELASYNPTNLGYFARVASDKKVVPGYADTLDSAKKRIIDRATALYGITDDTGKLHFDKYSSAPQFTQRAKMPNGEDAK